MGYFDISEYYREIPEIDGWIWRRIQLCYWKQWRRCRTKIQNLLALGTQLGTASVRTRMPGGVGLGEKNPRLPDWVLSSLLFYRHVDVYQG